MRPREQVTRKHVHLWKLTQHRHSTWTGTYRLERTCECGRVQNTALGEGDPALLPEPLRALCDVMWYEGKLLV